MRRGRWSATKDAYDATTARRRLRTQTLVCPAAGITSSLRRGVIKEGSRVTEQDEEETRRMKEDDGDVSNNDEDHEDEKRATMRSRITTIFHLEFLHLVNLTTRRKRMSDHRRKNNRSEALKKTKEKAAADLQDDDILGLFLQPEKAQRGFRRSERERKRALG